MLISVSKLIGTPVLSVQASGPVAIIDSAIVDPDSLKIIGFHLSGPLVHHSPANILDTTSIREFSPLGCVVDSVDEFVEPSDVIKIDKVLSLNFDLIGLKVETKKHTNLGRVASYTVTSEDFTVQQLIVQRPLIKSFLDPELTIPRSEIIEITDYKVIVKDEERTIKERAQKEDFIPNFVNPFRNSEQVLAPNHMETPADTNTE